MTPEQFDKWRVVPRLLLILYGFICWHVTDWFMNLDDATTQHAALVTVIWGAATGWFGLYVNSGGKNDKD